MHVQHAAPTGRKRTRKDEEDDDLPTKGSSGGGGGGGGIHRPDAKKQDFKQYGMEYKAKVRSHPLWKVYLSMTTHNMVFCSVACQGGCEEEGSS